jgi:hypothetical protein
MNTWDESFPRSLLPQLQEWLTVWRPRPNFPYLFASRGGDPYNTPSM